MAIKYNYKKHQITNCEKLWLQEVYNSKEAFSPRSARVKLHSQLPEGFDPNKIDYRLYSNGRLGIIGLWCIAPKDPLFNAIDKTILAIKQLIQDKPDREEFSADQIASITGIDRDLIGKAFYQVFSLGDFGNEASGASAKKYSHDKIWIKSEKTCGSYSNYKGLDTLLEKHYISNEPLNQNCDHINSVKQSSLKSSSYNLSATQKTAKEDYWEAIEDEYDVSKRIIGKKIHFITDNFKRKIIFRDIEQAYSLAIKGFHKPAIILSGGVIEELLRLYLKYNNITPQRNSFSSYIKACEEHKLLIQGVHRLTDSVRGFRNFVHLQKEETKRHSLNKATAKSAVASIFTIISDFQ